MTRIDLEIFGQEVQLSRLRGSTLKIDHDVLLHLIEIALEKERGEGEGEGEGEAEMESFNAGLVEGVNDATDAVRVAFSELQPHGENRATIEASVMLALSDTLEIAKGR